METDCIPLDFKCCITKLVMQDPVSTTDGHTYEREAIAAWFATGKNTSPATGLPLQSQALVPNIALAKAIRSFLEEVPHLQTQASHIQDLQACLKVREMDLKSLQAKHANMVPRLDYERLLLKLQAVERDLAEARAPAMPVHSTIPDVLDVPAQPESSLAQTKPAHRNEDDGLLFWDALLAQRRTELQRRKALVEAEQLRIEREIADLEQVTKTNEADMSAVETDATEKETEAASYRKKVTELVKEHEIKVQDRDAKGEEFISQAEEVGVDEPQEVLTKVREDPSAPRKGKALIRYAELHTECATLSESKQETQGLAMAAEEAASELRTRASGMSMKLQAMKERLNELGNEASRCTNDVCSAEKALADVGVDMGKVQETMVWAQHCCRGFLTPTAENVPILMILHEQARMQQHLAEAQRQHASLLVACAKGQSGGVLADARTRGCGAGTLWSAGCSIRELVEARYTATDLKAAGISAAIVFAEGFTVEELRSLGYTAAEGKEGGYPDQDLANAYLAAELKEAGITASLLKGKGFGASVLHAHGYGLQDLQTAGFALEDILRVMGAVVPEEPVLARCMRVFHDIPEARNNGEELYSEELRFSTCSAPQHRYSFKISVVARVQDSHHNGTVGIGFLPRAGPDPDALVWPMRHRFRLRVLSSDTTGSKTHGHKTMMLDLATNEGARAFFAEHAPPSTDNALGWGFLNFLTKEEYESGNYLFQGSLVIQCELLPP